MDITRIIPLKEKEKIIKEVRQYFLTFFWPLLLALLFLLLPFFLIFPLFRYGIFGMIIFFILLFVGILLLIRVLVVWYLNIFIITSQRIIILDRKGLWEKSAREACFEHVNDVSFKQKGLMQTLFGFGRVVLLLKGLTEPFVLKRIKDPNLVYQIIVEQQRFYKKIEDNQELSRSELSTTQEQVEQKIQELILRYGLERVSKIVAKLKQDSLNNNKNVNNNQNHQDKKGVDLEDSLRNIFKS